MLRSITQSWIFPPVALALCAGVCGAEPTAVIELAYQDVGQEPRVSVVVYDDGTIIDREGNGRGACDPADLRSLIADVVNRQMLTTIQTASLTAEIQAESQRTGKSWRIDGAGTTILRFHQNGTIHEVRCHAAGLLAERFPDIETLQRFHHVEGRLRNLQAVVRVGGAPEADRLAELANRELNDLGEVTRKDLRMVRSSGDGLRYAQFQCDTKAEDGRRIALVVAVFESPNAATRVTVSELPARQ
jgi:YD repeat-containing protein